MSRGSRKSWVSGLTSATGLWCLQFYQLLKGIRIYFVWDMKQGDGYTDIAVDSIWGQ